MATAKAETPAPAWLRSEHVPSVVILTAATAGIATAVLLGGPRLGYVMGMALSAVVVLALLRRYSPSLHIRWLTAVLIGTYCAGAAFVVGDDVLAHISIGTESLRYDRGLHVFGAAVTVVLVAEIVDRRHVGGMALVLTVTIVAGLLVESVELLNAMVLPSVFSYDLGDSSFDVLGNVAGLGVGLVALVWSRRRRSPDRRGRRGARV